MDEGLVPGTAESFAALQRAAGNGRQLRNTFTAPSLQTMKWRISVGRVSRDFQRAGNKCCYFPSISSFFFASSFICLTVVL